MPRWIFPSPLGPLVGVGGDGGWTHLWFSEEEPGWEAEDPVLDGASTLLGAALEVWFGGDLDALATVPLAPEGTHFQQAVWGQLRLVPAGQTTTYGALAADLGYGPASARAVGAAVGRNPLAILVPCHRVLGADGSLTGFAWGLERKAQLLAHEGWRDPRAAQLRLL